MRDPARIPDVLARLQPLWERVPDYRLAQVIQLAGTDPYYLEDDALLERIEAQLSASEQHKAPGQQPLDRGLSTAD
jgi:hypothetical protein